MDLKIKIRTLLLAGMAAPAAFGQVPAVPDMERLRRPFGAD